MDIIKFWSPQTGNYWLSNFYPAEIEWDGLVWPTSEHLYQSLKLKNRDASVLISKMETPREAKRYARTFENEGAAKITLPEKTDNMRHVIKLKFEQNPGLAQRLIATKGIIIEASPTDSIWGMNEAGFGMNLMGLLLMELREILREADDA